MKKRMNVVQQTSSKNASVEVKETGSFHPIVGQIRTHSSPKSDRARSGTILSGTKSE